MEWGKENGRRLQIDSLSGKVPCRRAVKTDEVMVVDRLTGDSHNASVTALLCPPPLAPPHRAAKSATLLADGQLSRQYYKNTEICLL